MRFLLFAYTFLFLTLIINQLYVFAILSILLIPIVILVRNFKKKIKIDEYRKKIEEATESFKNNKPVIPFINVNTEHWSILELIPGVPRVRAKIIANNVKRKKITSFTEFADTCNLDPAIYNLVKSIIKFY